MRSNVDLTNAEWSKHELSNGGNNCLDVVILGVVVALRGSADVGDLDAEIPKAFAGASRRRWPGRSSSPYAAAAMLAGTVRTDPWPVLCRAAPPIALPQGSSALYRGQKQLHSRGSATGIQGGTVEAELATLAATGATTLVGLMVSDVWTTTRERVARFLARGEGTGAVDDELETSREELIAARDGADPDVAADVEEEWRLRLRRALRADPAAAQELRALIDDLVPPTVGVPTVILNNNVSGGTQNAPFVQGQHFSGGMTLYGSGATPPAQGPGTA